MSARPQIHAEYTRLFPRIMDAVKSAPIVINRGGTRSSKSFSLDQLYILNCWNNPGRLVAKVARYLAWLKAQNWPNTLDILQEWGLLPFVTVNKAELTITFPNKSQIYFLGMDKERARGGRGWNDVHFEEADLLSYESFMEFKLRQSRPTPAECPNRFDLSFNPVDEQCWVKTQLMDAPEWQGRWTEIVSNYQDNGFLTPEYKDDLLRTAAANPNYKRIHIDGEWGRLEGRILSAIDYADWPARLTAEVHGLDFGYAAPSACVRVGWDVERPGELFVHEEVYQPGLSNNELAGAIHNAGYRPGERIQADSAEPKSIDELHRLGLNIHPSEKGRDSVAWGMNTLAGFRIHFTPASRNAYREAQGWVRQQDKGGRYIDEEVPVNNHAMSALRYAMEVLHKLIKANGQASPDIIVPDASSMRRAFEV
jgi:phage terminase large subunit